MRAVQTAILVAFFVAAGLAQAVCLGETLVDSNFSKGDFAALGWQPKGAWDVFTHPKEISNNPGPVARFAANQPGGYMTETNGPIWGGVTPRQAPREKEEAKKPAKGDESAASKDNSALLDALKAKILPDKETSEPVEGLLYFPIDGKIKPKDLAVLYKGPAGRLVIEFANPK